MTDTARNLLVDGGTCPFEKVRVVPHGAPPVLARRASELAIKRALGEPTGPAGSSGRLDDRFLLSTFGLISAGKGLETVIEALPAIVETHPDVLYLIAGRTHPDIAHREGERYRMTLERAVLDLGLEGHVEFDDRFLSIDEIADLLAATDVFVTPYRAQEQISSGALTFALAAGCGVVSTPYWYAQDMLESGAGTIVPFADSAALATPCATTSRSRPRLMAARAEARRIGEQLAWPSVAAATAAVLREAVELAPRRRRSVPLDRQRVTMRTDHLLTLVDDVGIIQHANGVIPNRESGYCVDDVARLAVVALELARRGDEQVWTSIVYRSLAFLQDATDAGPRAAELHGLRPALARCAAPRRPRRALDLGAGRDSLDRLGPGRRRAEPSDCSTRSSARSRPTSSLRTGAYAALGLARLDPDRLDPAARALLKRRARAAGRRRTPSTRARAGSGSRSGSRTTTPASHTRSSSAASRSARTR